MAMTASETDELGDLLVVEVLSELDDLSVLESVSGLAELRGAELVRELQDLSVAELLGELDDPSDIAVVLEAADAVSATAVSVSQPEKIEPVTDSESSDSATLSDVFDEFLERKNCRPVTISKYKRTVPKFIEFANQNGVVCVSALSIELIDSYLTHLHDQYDSDATILTHTKYVRAWLDWLHKWQRYDQSLHLLLNREELDLSPDARDEAIPPNEAHYIIEQLQSKRRGSPQHALMELLWNGGPRLGGVHSLDLRDFNPELNELVFRHRPATDTWLKNGNEDDGTKGDGERNIELKDRVVEAIEFYVAAERPDVTDEYGRKPLFATEHGRAAKSTLRRWVYAATSCQWADASVDGPACDGSCHPNSNVCPRSYYPHAIRRGAIVTHLSGGLRLDRASERFDVSPKVLRAHYDPRSERERKEDRADAVKQSWDDW